MRKSIVKEENLRKVFIKKVIICIVSIVLSTIMMAFCLKNLQNQMVQYNQTSQSNRALDHVVELLQKNEENIENLTSFYHKMNNQMLEDVYQCGIQNKSTSSIPVAFQNVFDATSKHNYADYLCLINNKGDVVASIENADGVNLINSNLMRLNLISKNDIKRLLAQDNDSFIKASTEDGNYYVYAKAVSNYTLILGMNDMVLNYQSQSLSDISDTFQTSMLGESGFLFAMDPKTKKFTFYENKDINLTKQNVLDCGLDEKILKDRYTGIQTIQGQSYYCVTRMYNDKMEICAAIPVDDIFFRNDDAIHWILLFYFIVVSLMLIYSLILRNYFHVNKSKSNKKTLHLFIGPRYMDLTLAKRVGSFVLILTIFMYFVSFYTITILSVDKSIRESESTVKTINAHIVDTTETNQYVESFYNNHFLAKTAYIAYLLEENPSFLNESTSKHYTYYDENNERKFVLDDEENHLKSIPSSNILEDLCSKNEFLVLYVFDDMGHTIATNTEYWYFSLSHDENNQSYKFLDVLDGKQDEMIQDAMVDDNGELHQYIGVSFRYYTKTDDMQNTIYVSKDEFEKDPIHVHAHDSLLQVGLHPFIIDNASYSTDTSYILDNTVIPYQGYVTMFGNDEEHTIKYTSQTDLIGLNAKEIGISDSAFLGKYTGFQYINGLKYISTVRKANDGFIAVNMLASDVYQGRFEFCTATSLLSFIFLVMSSFSVLMSKDKDEENLYRFKNNSKNKIRSSLPFISKLDIVQEWSGMTPEQKIIEIIKLICFVYAVYSLILLSNVGGIWDDSIESYIISGYWDHNFNIFSLSNCALIMFSMFIWVSIINSGIRLISRSLSTKTETLAHLLMSLFKYGGTLTALFYCLYLVGFDSASLLTSAGILSLVIGLGAQSMIADILAGVSIVFEGAFQVGDVVMIDKHRGQVLDIGLRTTKIENEDNNIVVFNNSKILTLMNMTRELSIITTIVKINHGVSLFKVEDILKMELPYVKAVVPMIRTGPFYKGIEHIGEDKIELAIVTYCRERDIVQVERDLNRMMYLILRQHGLIENDDDEVIVSKKEG